MEYLKGHDLYKILSLKDYTGFDEKDMSLIIFQLLKLSQNVWLIHNLFVSLHHQILSNT